MKCPRCSSVFSATADAAGVLACPHCGARLRTRPAGSAPGPVALPQATPAPAAALSSLPSPGRGSEPDGGLEAILSEIRGLRLGQDEILALLRNRHYAEPPAVDDSEPSPEPEAALEPPPLRKRRRKTVLLVDDQEQTRKAALAALEAAEVPTRVVADGRAALEAIATEKPDIIAIDLAIDGPMAGKDVINMIKATMEWVDIPIILYTRLPIASQKEARTLHGGDELVLKGPGSAETLVTRVIQVFRRP